MQCLLGRTGILTQANKSKTATKDAEGEEVIKLLLNEWQIEKYTGTKDLETFLNDNFESVVDNGDGTYTVTLDGYEAIVDANGSLVGNIRIDGLVPVVDEASIKITTDGTTVPEDYSLDKGTPVQITFSASIEGGEITSIEPALPYTTSGTEIEKEFTITGTVNGETYTAKKTISVVSKYMDHTEVVVPTITATGDLANNDNIAEVREGNIPIPAGFTYVKGDKIGGAVITDGRSEFVWVPVDTPSLMYGIDTSGKKWGKIYTMTAIGSEDTAKNWTEEDGKIAITATSGSVSYREPDIVSDYDGSSTYLGRINGILGTSYSTSSEFLADMEIDFNNMIESVEKYKGFYVGRYETSLNSNGVAQSKQGETSSNASEENNYRWYGLYARQKLYSTESVQGSMIWGCQYDAMMKWMKGNGIDVTSTTPTDLSIGTTSKNTTRITGGANEGETVSKDKISNIYDLLGNSLEWTLEAGNTFSRAGRGGSYWHVSSSPSKRYYDTAFYTFDYSGSRLTLYIQP